MLYAIVSMLVIIADQWMKYWVSSNFSRTSPGEPLISGILSLVNVQNDGAAFGFLSGGGARIYFIILTGVFTVAVILALATNFISGRLGRWSIVLMTAGGLSNCIDRVINGYVQDMFKIELFNFPVFNLADVFITVFCLLFVLAIIFGKRDTGYDDEFAEEDDEEEDRPRREKKVKEPKEPKPKKSGRKGRKAKYEDEYEQYKANRAARQQAEPQPQPQPQRAPAYDASDPFAEWEKANAKAGNQTGPYAAPAQREQAQQQPARPARQSAPQQARPVRQAPPAQQPARPAPQPAPQAAPKKSSDTEFDLDDILAEFK